MTSRPDPNTRRPAPALTLALRRALPAAAALGVLNALLSFKGWWPTPAVLPQWAIAPEWLALWVAAIVLSIKPGLAGARTHSALALAYTVLVIAYYADVTARTLLGRSINLYWDTLQLPRFLWVTAGDRPPWQSAGAVLLFVAGLWALHRLVHWATGLMLHQAAPYAARAPWTWLPTGAALVFVGMNFGWAGHPGWSITQPMTPLLWRQGELISIALSPSRQAEVLPPRTAVDAALEAPRDRVLARLAGRDVVVMVLESYGATVYDEPGARQALAPWRQHLLEAVRASGRDVVSAFVRSPTFGGASDFAHLGLLSGIDLDISQPLLHDILLTTQRPTLITLFKSHGYRAYGVYPSVHWEWPERGFYGFDVYLPGPALNYLGPALGFWRIPDAAAVALFERDHRADPHDPPRFVFFPTISTHMPFAPVPPHQPDWARLVTAQPFDPEETRRLQQLRTEWIDLYPNFLRAFEYNHRWLADWMRQPEPRETVFVLVGDHQPMASVTGEKSSWDVPVHVISRDRELLQRFVERGFHPGMEPPRHTLGRLHELTGLMIDAFSR